MADWPPPWFGSINTSHPEIPGQMTFWDMEPCPCGRPELGQHEKYAAQWLCRAGYLEKEIGYALSELERGGDWPAAGLRRLEKLVGP